MRLAIVAALVGLAGCGASKSSLGTEGPPGDGGGPDDAGGRADTSVRDAASDAPVADAGTDAGLPPNQPPIAAFTFTRGAMGSVVLDGSASHDPDGRIVRYAWDFGDGMMGEGEHVAHSYAAAGCPTVRLTVTDDRGAGGMTEQRFAVALVPPAVDVVSTLGPLPRPGALLPRDVATNRATFTVSGTVASEGWEDVVVRVRQAGTVEQTLRAPVCAGAFSIDVSITAELLSRDVEVVLVAADREAPLGSVADLVAGDVLLVQGQSNAVSMMSAGDASENQGDFLRSFGTRTETGAASAADDAWHRAEGNANEGPGAVGQWPLRMGAQLVAAHHVPIAILNGARGGEPIEYFQRNDADPADLSTNYGRLLERTRRIGVAAQVRAILFYQGESDGARAVEHRDGFGALHADWQEDFPGVERFYVTQVRSGCGSPTLELRDAQRRFAETLPRTSVMSTHALDAHDGCHYAYEQGYRELGDRYARLLSRDLYGEAPTADVEAVNVTGASLVGDTVVVHTSGDASALTVADGVAADFVLAGTTRTVTMVAAEGTDLVLTLGAGAMPPTQVGYVGHPMSGPWITNATGVGLLAFQLDVAP